MEEIERLANERAEAIMQADTEGILQSLADAKDCALEEIIEVCKYLMSS